MKRFVAPWFALLIGATTPVAAAAQDADLRTAVVPSAGTVVRLHPRVAAVGAVSLRWVAFDPTDQSDLVGTQLQGGLRLFVHPILGLGVDYAYGHGRFPIEGTYGREHRASVGVRTATPGKRFMVSDRLRVDLRGLRARGNWHFRVRPRNELVATVIFREWMQTSVTAEGLLQPQDGWSQMLQVRAGLALHGQIATGERRDGQRPPPSLQWLIADQVVTHPIALWRARAARVAGLAGQTMAPGHPGQTVDMVVTFGLSGVF